MPKLSSDLVGVESELCFRGPVGARGAVPPGTKCCQQPLRYKQSLEKKAKRLRMEIVVDDDAGAAVVAAIERMSRCHRADEPLTSSG